MALEVYLLCIFIAVTLLGYMIAINSHGPTRLSVSYLIATLMLAGTVWAIVQYVNSGLDEKKMAEFKKLEREKQKAEQRVRMKEKALMENKKRMNFAAKLNDIINEGTGLSTKMMNVDLRDFSVNLDVLIGRASVTRRACKALKERYDNLEKDQDFFEESRKEIEEAIDQINGASAYYVTYFRSEDAAQEEMRERMMRQKARKAYELFKGAASKIASKS